MIHVVYASISIFIFIFIQFLITILFNVTCHILFYCINLSNVYINSIYMYNYHKLFCRIVVAFCTSCILDVLRVFPICMFSCLYIMYVTI
jgi:hypothetical protein